MTVSSETVFYLIRNYAISDQIKSYVQQIRFSPGNAPWILSFRIKRRETMGKADRKKTETRKRNRPVKKREHERAETG